MSPVRIARFAIGVLLIFVLSSCEDPPVDELDLLTLYTAKEIITLDPAQPYVEAIAIDGDRIVAAGRLDALREQFADRSIQIDRRFNELVLVPGLINQHEHAWLAAIVMLTEVISIEDWDLPERRIERARDGDVYRQRLKDFVAQRMGSTDVLYTWGYHQLFHGPLARADLDLLSPDIPLVVLQRSMHEMIFNSLALERFGIGAETIEALPEPIREQTDLANGHFWEQGLLAVAPAVFPDLYAPERYLPALERVERYWHAAGTTLVAEPGGLVAPELVAMQNRILGDELTPFRMLYIADGKTIAAAHPEEAIIDETEKLFGSAQGMTRFLPKQVKLFIDGAMFSQLMKMRDGYLDGHEGEWLMQPEDFARAFRVYWDAGYQIHVHTNGDAGLDLLLDTLEENATRNPRTDHRTVVVHFGFSRPEQVDRLVGLGALVSANPFYTTVLADRYAEVGIGPERSSEMVRLGDVVRAGGSISLHADMPMAPGQPLLLMDSAVNRITLDGNLIGPRQRISAERALRAVTLDAAYSLGLEEELGSIEAGKLANVTVLEQNPLRTKPSSIRHIRVWGTIHEGRVLPRARPAPAGPVGAAPRRENH